MKGDPTRRRSNNEHAPNNAALQGILAVSDTLTYKQVRRFFPFTFRLWGVLHLVFMGCFAPCLQCCGSGMFIPDPNFFHPGSASKYFNPKKWFLSSRKYDTACSSRIRIPDPDPEFLTIPDPGVKKAADPGSGSATLLVC